MAKNKVEDQNMGGVTPRNSEPKPARSPTGTNLFENQTGGWGLKTLGLSAMQTEGFNVVNEVVTNFMKAWTNKVDRNEIESEAMWWLAKHQDKLMASESREQFYSYAYVCLTRKLSHLSQTIILHGQKFILSGDLHIDPTTYREMKTYKTITVEEVKVGLENGREEFFKLIEKNCTKSQKTFLIEKYVFKKTVKNIAEEYGKEPAAVYYLISQGIRNIASKGYTEDRNPNGF